MGLENTFTIGRIRINPKNTQILFMSQPPVMSGHQMKSVDYLKLLMEEKPGPKFFILMKIQVYMMLSSIRKIQISFIAQHGNE